MAQTKEQKAAYNREWRKNNPDKVKGYNAKYAASDKGKATNKRYSQSEKGKATRKRASEKYVKSPKGKAAAERAKLSKYGITREMYALMYGRQGGVCYLCKNPEKEGRSLAVDHCHTTGKVRALLCMECNTGLGKFRDDPELLRAAAKYLKVHSKRAAA